MPDEPGSVDRDVERLRVAGLLATHAPPDWEERFRRDDKIER